ncbi:hypothetical protein [Kitasatospora phosalacinea]|uniref:Uncharacterized protein n=1 Tax=Kitasatospora phosalacinea TaxID=2065 RepID=A0A9W6PAM5_9ACTN|nr:hypothetical protein [Kitasatospora phosalacinea]GLW52190.1 hypothetical protein Kpho01_02010 [Kitasatospora phosalacinea]
MPIALPHPEGVPVVGLLVLTVLGLLMCAEIVLRGSGSRTPDVRHLLDRRR